MCVYVLVWLLLFVILASEAVSWQLLMDSDYPRKYKKYSVCQADYRQSIITGVE